MFHRLRTHITPSTIIATLALLFAMSGGAYAASHYLITSTKQISPKVLKALTGKAGPAGKAGANGANGAPGAQGPQGPAGTNGTGTPGAEGKEGPPGKNGTNGENGKMGFTKTLPAKETETGSWSVSVGLETQQAIASISFPIPLEKPLGETAVHYVETEGNGTTCPGSAEKPEAQQGNLCIYQREVGGLELEVLNIDAVALIRPANTGFFEATPGAATSGALVKFNPEDANGGYAWGTWAVTAPEA